MAEFEGYYWLLHIAGDVEPQPWLGPFKTWTALVAAAQRKRDIQGGLEDGLYWTTTDDRTAPPEIDSFVGGVFTDD